MTEPSEIFDAAIKAAVATTQSLASLQAQCGSLTTAISNDYGFEEIFARQVTAFGERGDVLVAITTSGNSRNVVRAIEEARATGLTSVALLGRDGGSTKSIADIELIVPSDSTARIQEAHKFLLHVLCEIVESRLHH